MGGRYPSFRNAADVERRIGKGFGQGRGAAYRPWLRVQEVPSKGRSHRVVGVKVARTHHLLSDLEAACLFALEYQRSVEDIREQFPLLPVEVTQAAAALLGVHHPRYPFTGAKMICELVRQGARVGVTAVSHPVIRNLLETVLEVADNSGVSVECVRKVRDPSEVQGRIVEYKKNEDIDDLIDGGERPVIGGTPFLWARPELQEKLDVLLVDEAGQMSLANVLAACQCARNVVLLGDPQQLEQPQQGSHPPGADLSALEHILKDHPTIPPERGIFLPETWRLPPAICAFTSEVFYECKLHSLPGLERREIKNTGPIEGTGLWVLPVAHEGNKNSSSEEVDAIERLTDQVLHSGAKWIDRDGSVQPLTGAHILVVAPYNSQVALLTERLGPRGIRVGTVDKFQGQQAPIVIYSMATSAAEDAPRGMEFLYSLNRLNVATSRAQCACILVASPRLFAPECKTPGQMRLANALCRYVEMANPLPGL